MDFHNACMTHLADHSIVRSSDVAVTVAAAAVVDAFYLCADTYAGS